MRTHLLLAGLLAITLHAQTTPRTPTPNEGDVNAAGRFRAAGEPATNVIANEQALRERLTVQQVGTDGLRIGPVDVAVATRTVSFPAEVNQLQGILEYAVVHRSGKVHEALFRTEARPEEIHLACLLLGVTNAPVPLAVEVTWDRNGPPARHALEDLLRVNGQPMSPGWWRYTGSEFDAAGFAATRDGSVIAAIRDGGALAENPRPEAMDDNAHSAASNLLPRVGMPVRVHLRFDPAAR